MAVSSSFIHVVRVVVHVSVLLVLLTSLSSSSGLPTAFAFVLPNQSIHTPIRATAGATAGANAVISHERRTKPPFVIHTCSRTSSLFALPMKKMKKQSQTTEYQMSDKSDKINKNGLQKLQIHSDLSMIRPIHRRCQSAMAAVISACFLCTHSMTLSSPSTTIIPHERHHAHAHHHQHVQQAVLHDNLLLDSRGTNPNKSTNNNFMSIFIEAASANVDIDIDIDIYTSSSSSATTDKSNANAQNKPFVPTTSTNKSKPQLSPKQIQKLEQSTVLDEVWTLVDKYYIDRTFQNQNWSTMRSTYESKLPINPMDGSYDDEEAMKLATSMVSSLGDKYSRILDKPAYARIQKFDLIGVGATLMPSPEDKRIMVGAPPVDGSEAQKGGIQYGDYIIAVNGVNTQGRTAFQIIDQISEDPNSKTVTMTVLTEGPDDLKGEGFIRDVTMKRQTMEVKNPISYKITERRKDGTVVGYIRLSEFNSLVEAKLKEALVSLREDGANAYVLDMRSNPGGAFQSAVEIASFFMEDKIATTVVDSNAVEMPFKTAKGKVMIDESNPLVIWIDGGSASATEVLAGALHDQCRASIMGSHSFGKGLIQAVYGLRNGSGLVLTVAKYVTPNGTDIQGSGITVDLETKLPFLYLPKVSSDTTKVDFGSVSGQNKVCGAPQD